ncbi:MAG: hypothetical protein ACE149_01675 [Armatimonadota bacterium]
MRASTRCVVLALVVVTLALAAAATADTKWPNLMRYTLALSTDEFGRYQASLYFTGPVAENMTAKVEGWWIKGTGDDRAFVGDAYLDYTRKPLYLAAGRKFVMFGPIGVLVSPGMFGGHLKLDLDRWELQALTGTLQFTPGTSSGNRFSFFGTRAPSDERVTALRLGGPLTGPDAAVPVKLGVNWLDVLDDTGSSVDIEIGATKQITLFGEAADFESSGNAYGVRWSDAATRADEKVWILVFYHRDIEIGFVPAAVGASVFFEDQRGWAGGLYHQFNMRDAIGVFADGNDAILTWFQTIPL